MKMKEVLFICVHNSGRSQMAEAFFNQLAKGKANALSAGTIPSSEINPGVAIVMFELGINLENKKPRKLTQDMLEGADKVITMGCGVEEACPAGFVISEDWELEDPKGKPLNEIIKIRDQIRHKVKQLIIELGL